MELVIIAKKENRILLERNKLLRVIECNDDKTKTSVKGGTYQQT